MTIEVRQMQINSTVLEEGSIETNESQAAPDYEEIKEQILAECRQLIVEILRAEREIDGRPKHRTERITDYNCLHTKRRNRHRW